MLKAIWSAATPHFDVDTFLSEFDFAPEEVWRRGETTSYGQYVETCGFSKVFEDGDSVEALLIELQTFLVKVNLAAKALQQRGIPSTLDFGFTIGGHKHFTRSLRFPPDFLSLLVGLGISLKVSAYPTSDD